MIIANEADQIPPPPALCVALVGMPGSGKSTVGRHLARQLSLPFIDTDAELERQLGMPIREFFEAQGESAFREHECRVIAEFTAKLAYTGGVLATGGGAVLSSENQEALRQRCQVFYLRATPEDLYRRLRHDRQRPLLQVADPQRRLRDLYRQRDPLYRQVSHYTVESARPSVSGLLQMILMQLELAGWVDPQQVPSSIDGAPPAD